MPTKRIELTFLISQRVPRGAPGLRTDTFTSARRLPFSMGIADDIKGKLKQTPTGVFVGSIIASGEAEIGFQQVSELSHFAGVDYVGPLPADVQQFTMEVYSDRPAGSWQWMGNELKMITDPLDIDDILREVPSTATYPGAPDGLRIGHVAGSAQPRRGC